MTNERTKITGNMVQTSKSNPTAKELREAMAVENAPPVDFDVMALAMKHAHKCAVAVVRAMDDASKDAEKEMRSLLERKGVEAHSFDTRVAKTWKAVLGATLLLIQVSAIDAAISTTSFGDGIEDDGIGGRKENGAPTLSDRDCRIAFAAVDTLLEAAKEAMVCPRQWLTMARGLALMVGGDTLPFSPSELNGGIELTISSMVAMATGKTEEDEG